MHLPFWRAKLGIALPRKVQSSFCATQEALAVLRELLRFLSRLQGKIQFSPYLNANTDGLVCNLYSTQRPPSGCRSSGTDRHLLLPSDTAARVQAYTVYSIFSL